MRAGVQLAGAVLGMRPVIETLIGPCYASYMDVSSERGTERSDGSTNRRAISAILSAVAMTAACGVANEKGGTQTPNAAGTPESPLCQTSHYEYPEGEHGYDSVEGAFRALLRDNSALKSATLQGRTIFKGETEIGTVYFSKTETNGYLISYAEYCLPR